MPAPATAWVPRAPAPNPGGLRTQPDHRMGTSIPMVDQGDPFPQHNIRYGEFYMQGKIKHDPGVHLNYYTNIRGQNAIMNKFFGFITKLRYRPGISIARGQSTNLGSNPVNIERPSAVTLGELSTVSAANRQSIIHSGGVRH